MKKINIKPFPIKPWNPDKGKPNTTKNIDTMFTYVKKLMDKK